MRTLTHTPHTHHTHTHAHPCSCTQVHTKCVYTHLALMGRWFRASFWVSMLLLLSIKNKIANQLKTSGRSSGGSMGFMELPFQGLPSKILYAQTYYVHYAHTGAIYAARNGDMVLVYDSAYFLHVMQITICFAVSATWSRVMPLILQALNTITGFSMHPMRALLAYWKPPFQNSRSATENSTVSSAILLHRCAAVLNANC